MKDSLYCRRRKKLQAAGLIAPVSYSTAGISRAGQHTEQCRSPTGPNPTAARDYILLQPSGLALPALSSSLAERRVNVRSGARRWSGPARLEPPSRLLPGTELKLNGRASRYPCPEQRHSCGEGASHLCSAPRKAATPSLPYKRAVRGPKCRWPHPPEDPKRGSKRQAMGCTRSHKYKWPV